MVTVAGLATMVATAAAFYGVLTVVGRDDRASYVERYAEDVGRTLRAAIDPRYQTKAEEIGRVASRLVVIEAIKGGALFDDTGHRLQTFGEVPETSFATIEHTGKAVFQPTDATRMEFYYPPAATGTPIHIVARVDAGAMTALEGASLQRRLVVALLSAVILGSVASLIAWFTVARPVRRIIGALERTIANPAGSDTGPALRAGPTEIGILGQAVDRFRATLADVWRTKVVVADQILQNAPFGVVQLAPDGSPSFANPAAAALFNRDVVRAHTATPLVVRDVVSGGRSMLREHLQLHQDDCRLVEVTGPDGSGFAVAGSLTIGAGTRTQTVIAMFADVTATHRARLKAEQRYADEMAVNADARRRELELKLMLESCLTLLAGPDKAPEVHIDVMPFAVEWLTAAREVGLIADFSLAEPEGPTVAGPSDDLRAVVRLGLLVAATRGPAVPSTILVDARGINFETAGVTIRAEPIIDGSRLLAPPTADWRIAFAALRQSIRKVNGQLSDFTVEPDAISIRFILRGASERMSAVKAR